MNYRLLHNEDARFSRTGTEDDRYVLGYQGTIDGLDYEAIYARHNRDDRPDGQDRPSLSVGDVILISAGTIGGPGTRAVTVDVMGFRELPTVPSRIYRTYTALDRATIR